MIVDKRNGIVYVGCEHLVRGSDEEADVSERAGKDSERYYRAYQRHMAAGLVFVVCLVAYNVWRFFEPANTALQSLYSLLIGAAFLIALLIVHLVTLRGHLWNPRGAGERTVLQDEWVGRNRGRATAIAFWVMLGAQVPMTFVMAYVPSRPEQGVVGMGTMTFLLGLGTFLAAFLYYSRQPSDG